MNSEFSEHDTTGIRESLGECNMTKDVLITISGMQFDVGDAPIELKTIGSYYLKNGKHYVLFDEQPEGDGPVTKNIVKFKEDSFEMTKKGGNNSYLLFELGKKTSTVYCTPVGDIQVDVATLDLSYKESGEEIQVIVKYKLDINYTFISECEVRFKVQARM